jgi:hypothetical protein
MTQNMAAEEGHMYPVISTQLDFRDLHVKGWIYVPKVVTE